MGSISNLIESYLKAMLNESNRGYIEIQRNELAEQFKCVPSQINYVLATRFTINHGFVIESKRGGGGYVRIERVPLEEGDNWFDECYQATGESVSQQVADSILQRLAREEIITIREYRIMRAAVDRATLRVELPWRDKLRASILKAMIKAMVSESNK